MSRVDIEKNPTPDLAISRFSSRGKCGTGNTHERITEGYTVDRRGYDKREYDRIYIHRVTISNMQFQEDSL